ncbi:hypothetical protein ACFP59_02125 [Microbacterium koreense]
MESPTGRLAKIPAGRWQRWGLRLVIAAVYAALAVWLNAGYGGDWTGTANADLATRVDALRFDSGIAVIGDLYPPITSLIALVIPGGALGLAFAGAFLGGIVVQQVMQAQIRKGFPASVTIIVTLALATTPVYTYTVTTNFEATLGLMFFALGMLDLVRFVTRANTQAGFRAGLLFACSALSDVYLVFSALVAALGGALLRQSRTGARLANAIVVAFPTVAVFGSLALLGAAFGAGPLMMFRGDLSWSTERATAWVEFLATPSGVLYLAPVALIALAAIALGSPWAGLFAVLLNAATAVAFILGLTPPGTAGTTYIMLVFLAIAIIPSTKSRLHQGLIGVAAILLWGIGWATAFTWPVLRTWMETLGGMAS